MAHPPRHGNPWLGFFFGTPTRLAWTVAVVLLALAALFPQAAEQALSRALWVILSATQPLIGPILALCIALYAIGVILRPFKPKKKKKKH